MFNYGRQSCCGKLKEISTIVGRIQLKCTMYHTVNMAVMIYQFQDEIQSMQLNADTLSKIPIDLDPKEPAFLFSKER